MEKAGFIEELMKKTGLSQSDGEKVNEVMEANPLIGGDIGNIISQIAQKLGIGEDKAKEIFEKAKEILSGGILDKIKNPFGGQ